MNVTIAADIYRRRDRAAAMQTDAMLQRGFIIEFGKSIDIFIAGVLTKVAFIYADARETESIGQTGSGRQLKIPHLKFDIDDSQFATILQHAHAPAVIAGRGIGGHEEIEPDGLQSLGGKIEGESTAALAGISI